MIDIKKYWWCNKCKDNVDVLHAIDVGLFCIQCGTEVTKPKNIEDPIFYDDEEEDKEL